MSKAERRARKKHNAAQAALRRDLAWVAARRADLAEMEQDVVRAALAGGATYAELGAELGVSRQAAWERFRHLAPAGSRGR